ncbi:MAG: RHS repeat-associated core domain-containing protein [Bacteroidales bacterium]
MLEEYAHDPILGMFLSPDNYMQAPTHSQSFNRYSYCLGNPLRYVDPSGEFLTWSINNNGLSIGFNLTPIGIPIGAGVNIGWSSGGTAGVYAEVGYRLGGTGFGSGVAIQQSLNYNFKYNVWNTTNTQMAYYSFGPLTVGGNFSVSYDFKHNLFTYGWGVGVGFGIGNSKGSIGPFVGYGSGGWSYGISGIYYTRYERAYMRAEVRNRNNIKKVIDDDFLSSLHQRGKFYALMNADGRIAVPFFIHDESLAMNIIWTASFNDDGSVRCETAMYDVFDGYVILPNVENSFKDSKTYWGTLVKNRIITLSGNREYYVEAMVHTHPNNWGNIGISNKDFIFNQIIPVYIIYQGSLYDVYGNFIKKTIK